MTSEFERRELTSSIRCQISVIVFLRSVTKASASSFSPPLLLSSVKLPEKETPLFPLQSADSSLLCNYAYGYTVQIRTVYVFVSVRCRSRSRIGRWRYKLLGIVFDFAVKWGELNLRFSRRCVLFFDGYERRRFQVVSSSNLLH